MEVVREQKQLQKSEREKQEAVRGITELGGKNSEETSWVENCGSQLEQEVRLEREERDEVAKKSVIQRRRKKG